MKGVTTKRRLRPAGTTVSGTPVDRTSPRWQRIRAALCEHHGLPETLDEHADRVFALIPATTSPPGAGSTVEGPSAGTGRQTKGE